jgi:hypothetical protein
MAGMVINVLDRTDFNFTPTNAGLMAELPLTQNIDVSQYRECTLQVRVHAVSYGNAGSTISLRARRVAPTEEDPAQFFRDVTTSWTVTVTQGDTHRVS